MLKLFAYIQKINLKTAFLSKGDAFINILLMIINNFSFIFMWWVIFNNKGTINGWDFGDMALMFGISNLSFAPYALYFQGVNELPHYIETGSLESYLVTPRNILFMVATSFSTFANFGDIITGLLMYFVSGYVTINGFFLFIYLSFMAFILTFSVRLILSSLAFYNSGSETLGKNIFMAFLIFSNQPASIFTGIYKLLFLTIIPAGFISLFPVRILKSFTWSNFIIFTFAIFGFLYLSIFLFNKGLKNYTSGNRFGIR